MAFNQSSDVAALTKSLSRNPLGIIALFIVLVYGLASLVVVTGGALSQLDRSLIVYFLAIFPFVVLGVFTYLVAFRAGQLYAPGDFREERNYLELQRIRAVASLSAAQRTKGTDRPPSILFEIDDLARSVDKAVELSRSEKATPLVLWVDDNQNNNIYERQAFEAVGFRFILSDSTEDALNILSRQSVDAVISDIGRREGPEEGFALLDRMRSNGDNTPVFFYSGSNTPERRREALAHGGQGFTDDGQELFDMVTKLVFTISPFQRRSLFSKTIYKNIW